MIPVFPHNLYKRINAGEFFIEVKLFLYKRINTRIIIILSVGIQYIGNSKVTKAERLLVE